MFYSHCVCVFQLEYLHNVELLLEKKIPVVPTLMYLYYKLAYQIVKSAEHSDVYTIVVLCPLRDKRYFTMTEYDGHTKEEEYSYSL